MLFLAYFLYQWFSTFLIKIFAEHDCYTEVLFWAIIIYLSLVGNFFDTIIFLKKILAKQQMHCSTATERFFTRM